MSLVSSLPLELVHTILEADYLTAGGEPDRQFLRSCSLVCNSWSIPAQQLLFSNVVLRSEQDFDSFDYAVQQSPSLANAVQSLRVILDHNQPSRLRQQHLACTVTLCPRLNSINISLFGNESVDELVNDQHNDEHLAGPGIRADTGAPLPLTLRRPDGSNLAEAFADAPITSFHLNSWSSDNGSFTPILTALRGVKLLSLAGIPPVVPASVNPECSLTHLRVNFQQSPSVDFLAWLLSSSKDSLEALDLERFADSSTSMSLLDHLTTIHGGNLRSMILPSCATSTELKYFQRCTNIRSIGFRTPNVSPAVFKHLAGSRSSPEKTYICVDRNTALSPIIEFVRNSENLQSLVVCLWEEGVRKKMRLWGSLKMACAVNDVELKVVESLTEYKTIINSDWERI